MGSEGAALAMFAALLAVANGRNMLKKDFID